MALSQLSQIPDVIITNGLSSSSKVEEVQDKLLSVVCYRCNHPTCHYLPKQFYPSSIKLSQTYRNLDYALPAWSL